MAVTNQPGRYAPSDFQTGLCDICDDCGTCEHLPFLSGKYDTQLRLYIWVQGYICSWYISPPSASVFYGLFCTMCLGCSIASDMDECCLCGVQMSIRSVYRTKYNINVSFRGYKGMADSITPFGQFCVTKYDSFTFICGYTVALVQVYYIRKKLSF